MWRRLHHPTSFASVWCLLAGVALNKSGLALSSRTSGPVAPTVTLLHQESSRASPTSSSSSLPHLSSVVIPLLLFNPSFHQPSRFINIITI